MRRLISACLLARCIHLTDAFSDDDDLCLFQVKAEVTRDNSTKGAERASGLIPYNFIFTYAYDILNEDPKNEADQFAKENVRRVIDNNVLSDGTTPTVYFYSDEDCIGLLQELQEDFLVSMFELESHGPFKGDICRFAALYLHGGYYFDIDLGHRYAVVDLLPTDVGFATARDFVFTADAEQTTVPDPDRGLFFQAFLASVPEHPLIDRAIKLTKQYYLDTRRYDICPASSEELQESIQNPCQSSYEDFAAPDTFHQHTWSNKAPVNVGPYTLTWAYEQQQHESDFNEDSTFGKMHFFQEAKYNLDDVSFGKYESLHTIPAEYSYCNFVVYDPSSKRIMFFSRVHSFGDDQKLCIGEDLYEMQTHFE